MTQTQLNDLDFIKFFLNKGNYDSFYQDLDRSLLSIEPRNIIETFEDFHKFKELAGSSASFKNWFLQFKLKPTEDKETYKRIFTLLEERDNTSQDLILKEFRLRAIKKEIAASIQNNIDTFRLLAASDELRKIEDDTVDDTESCRVSGATDSLFDEDEFDVGYHWPIPLLDNMIHLIPPKGFFCVAAARPDASKSSMATSVAVTVARQLKDDEMVLWFNNENFGKRVKRRAIACALNRSEVSIKSARHAGFSVDKYYKKECGDRIEIFDVHNKDHRFIEKIVKKYKDRVKFIIIDMLDHVGLSKNMQIMTSNQDAYYGALYQWALGLSCTYASVLGTSQQSLNKGNKSKPNLEDLVGSKTLKQGAASCILMIGTDSERNEYRYLSTPKNKYGKGGQGWIKPVIFEAETCQFREVDSGTA